LLARELLSESGSVFVQIGDENVHHIKELLDEIFGKNNCTGIIVTQKTSSSATGRLDFVCDYVVWYAKSKDHQKYRQLFLPKGIDSVIPSAYNKIELSDGTRRSATKEEKEGKIPPNSKLYSLDNLTSARPVGAGDVNEYEFNGRKFRPGNGTFKTDLKGLNNLQNVKRLESTDNRLGYVRYLDDFPAFPLNNVWSDTVSSFMADKIYVVQTNTKIISRCLLMTTDPGDLVLDITCGSGTTAYVAEQWGRRWITCDTSRIAITLAKKRLMTATFDYYKLAHPDQGVSSGFVYKTVPHVTLKSIANNEPPEQETLYDQPESEKKKVRISGPFTVEALPAPVGTPVVKPLDEEYDTNNTNEEPNIRDNPSHSLLNAGKKLQDWCDELKTTGVLGKGGAKIEFSRVELLEETKFLHAEAETRESTPRHAVVCFAGETRPLDTRMVTQAMNEAESVRPKPQLIIFAAFQFDPAAAKNIDDTKWPGVTLLKAQMNTDLMTDDLKKNRSSNQSFWLVGQPDVELIPINTGDDKGKYKVIVRGFDYYDVKKGVVESGGTARIAMWMLDTDYDGMCVEPMQVFFPMEGANEGWDKLAKTLKAEINHDLIEKYHGTESLPFVVKDNTLIAVKIVDDRGIESLKVIPVGEK
jgi:adenine-specific DNA-methyltransferase